MQPVPSVTVEQVPSPLPEELTVLDVREPVEWQQGHVEGSLHIPLMELPDRIDEVPSDGPVLVVCKVGGRSARAVQYLRHLELEALNLDGGLVEWEAAGRPLVGDAGVPTVV